MATRFHVITVKRDCVARLETPVFYRAELSIRGPYTDPQSDKITGLVPDAPISLDKDLTITILQLPSSLPKAMLADILCMVANHAPVIVHHDDQGRLRRLTRLDKPDQYLALASFYPL